MVLMPTAGSLIGARLPGYCARAPGRTGARVNPDLITATRN
jgi:hypothetical protein